MNQILLICAVVALVGGCGGKKDDGNTGVVNPNKPAPEPGKSSAPLSLVPVDSMTQVHRDLSRNPAALLTDDVGQALELDGARGEHVHGQIVVVPAGQDLSGLTWRAPVLHGPGGSTVRASVRAVGYVKTRKPNYDADFVGWWPDPLLDDVAAVDVPLGTCQPLWISVTVPRRAQVGLYQGTLRLRTSSARQAIPLSLQVRNFSIPKTRHLRVANAWLPSRLEAHYGSEAWGGGLKWRTYNFILDHRLSVTSIYHLYMPMKDVSVSTLRRLRRAGQNVFVIHGLYPSIADKTDEIERILARCRKAGIPDSDLFFYGFDEVREDQRPGLIEAGRLAKELFPQVTTLTTANLTDLGSGDDLARTIDAWCPVLPSYVERHEARDAARERGKDVWWYTCCWPPHPYANVFVEYPAIESRLLTGAMSWKYQPDGFLYYALNGGDAGSSRRDGVLCRWNAESYRGFNGDGRFLYPGDNGPVSTIRLENLTDGLEDYEYFWVLRDLTERLDRHELGQTATGRALLESARTCLAVPESTIASLTKFTTDPRELARIRERVADSIEGIIDLGIAQPLD